MTTDPIACPPETPNESLRGAFSQLHNAVQWLARMVRSFRTGSSGSDVLLRWNEERTAFVTDEFSEGLRMELRLPELTLQFLEDGNPVKHELRMEGRSPAQVEAWVLVELLHRGLDRGQFSKELPYDIPNSLTGDSVEYSPDFCEDELKKLLDWLTGAANLLKSFHQDTLGKNEFSSRLVLRARDFSLETSVPLLGHHASEDNNRCIRIGFFPLRGGIVDPHYRVSRSEPETATPDLFEIIRVSGTTTVEIAGPQVVKRIGEVVAKMQKLAAQ